LEAVEAVEQVGLVQVLLALLLERVVQVVLTLLLVHLLLMQAVDRREALVVLDGVPLVLAMAVEEEVQTMVGAMLEQMATLVL
jgi:hypothetical protein